MICSDMYCVFNNWNAVEMVSFETSPGLLCPVHISRGLDHQKKLCIALGLMQLRLRTPKITFYGVWLLLDKSPPEKVGPTTNVGKQVHQKSKMYLMLVFLIKTIFFGNTYNNLSFLVLNALSDCLFNFLFSFRILFTIVF